MSPEAGRSFNFSEKMNGFAQESINKSIHFLNRKYCQEITNGQLKNKTNKRKGNCERKVIINYFSYRFSEFIRNTKIAGKYIGEKENKLLKYGFI